MLQVQEGAQAQEHGPREARERMSLERPQEECSLLDTLLSAQGNWFGTADL